MNTIIHMPHTSLDVPEEFYEGLIISKEEFNYYNLMMSDVGVDFLFKELNGVKIKPKYSRLYCDVERFRDDNDEIMSKVGQGVIYTHTFDGKEFHMNSKEYKEKVLKYYDNYHSNLDEITKQLLSKDDTLLILDIHSFSDKMASANNEGTFPDICIGIEPDYYNEEILNRIITRIKQKNLSYAINHPYKGSLVPNCIYRGEVKGNVISIMIEVNKRIYLV